MTSFLHSTFPCKKHNQLDRQTGLEFQRNERDLKSLVIEVVCKMSRPRSRFASSFFIRLSLRRGLAKLRQTRAVAVDGLKPGIGA